MSINFRALSFDLSNTEFSHFITMYKYNYSTFLFVMYQVRKLTNCMDNTSSNIPPFIIFAIKAAV
jgi:hypothetical protein